MKHLLVSCLLSKSLIFTKEKHFLQEVRSFDPLTAANNFRLGHFAILEFLPSSKSWPMTLFRGDSLNKALAGPGTPMGRNFA